MASGVMVRGLSVRAPLAVLTQTALGAGGERGVKVDLRRGQGENHRADIPALHDDAAGASEGALPVDHAVTDLGMGGHGRHVRFHFRSADLVRDVAAVPGYPCFAAARREPEVRCGQHGGESRLVGEGDPVRFGRPGQGAVHGARVHVDQVQMLGEGAGGGGFTGSGGSIDGDHRVGGHQAARAIGGVCHVIDPD